MHLPSSMPVDAGIALPCHNTGCARPWTVACRGGA